MSAPSEKSAEDVPQHKCEDMLQHIQESVQRHEEHFRFRGVNYRLVVWEPEMLSQAASSAYHADPVLLLHGFAQSADAWNEVAPALALGSIDDPAAAIPAPRLVVALDLVGHGKSDRPEALERYSFAETTAMLRALIEQRLGGRVVLIGYSMGGRIALVYACKGNADTLSALVLESASLGPATPDEREQARQSDARLVERLQHASITEFVDYWETLPLFASQQNLPETLRQSVRAERLANSTAALACSVEGMGKHAMPYCAAHMETLPVPLLFITGILDKKYSAFTKIFQNMDLVTCAAVRSGHNTHLENPKRFVQCIADFFEANEVL